ncbi:TetR family transcriptional regulator [Nocardia panacis]|uniref:TetR family transcriptional regulator n=1 Tax=Nocardia panacis TaxID=2340916 RepID=A0A3A4KRD1_9NOCA|nr:TetR family transcriptional regulator [Nocardia panacis]RJO75620.1 TetR family transcriptional regulator [Nocardia panacis]
MSENRTPRRRDPAGRRRLIVDTAAELIIERGGRALTHRLVAERAGVPLGSTTHYFATLDDLREEALHRLAQESAGWLARVRMAFTDRASAPAALAALLHDYLRDTRVVHADHAIATEALLDPELRALSLRWFDGLVEALTPHLGPTRATAVAVFVDGTSWHAALHDEPLSGDTLTDALTALCTGAQP